MLSNVSAPLRPMNVDEERDDNVAGEAPKPRTMMFRYLRQVTMKMQWMMTILMGTETKQKWATNYINIRDYVAFKCRFENEGSRIDLKKPWSA
jgi:hypothetical protein